ncbi:Veg family protein [Fuchsiella alkaliacetigena]|uniref:Veg family protein n=1 Tax=Fuchsiella alkaliacetigena TaxID=957042 RepID=UPI00200A05E4|nr:Veg family protein [Fuchsiella alkaliacetigena]MCK8824995.1 Veg family protein [Fuchsiella alkaliacetigena]
MANNILTQIKDDLESFVGKQVCLKANQGRKKIIQKEGVLEETYSNVFVVKVDEEQNPRRVSYSYADILTETVEIKIKDNNTKIGCVSV